VWDASGSPLWIQGWRWSGDVWRVSLDYSHLWLRLIYAAAAAAGRIDLNDTLADGEKYIHHYDPEDMISSWDEYVTEQFSEFKASTLLMIILKMCRKRKCRNQWLWITGAGQRCGGGRPQPKERCKGSSGLGV
jgi:hypothetical protein